MELEVRVYRCPDIPAVRHRIASLLEDLDCAGEPPRHNRLLSLIFPYTHGDVPAGIGRPLAAGLAGTSRQVAFTVRETGPAGGMLYAYAERLGMFEGPCDGAGQVRRAVGEVHEAIAQALPHRRRAGDRPDMGQIRDAIDRLYGVPWLQDLERPR